MDSMFEIVNPSEATLPERVADQIIQMILDEKLTSNDKLPNEFELAAQLNVGRGTIREAVKLLVSRNVLEIKRGRGTYISSQPGQIRDPFGLAYVNDKRLLAKDLMEVRSQIEPWSASLAAERATESERQKILACFQAMNDVIAAGGDHLPQDMEFHNAIAEAAHNVMLPKLIPVFRTYVQLAGNISDVLDTQKEHKAIVDAILNQDPEAAHDAMYRHLINARELLQVSSMDIKLTDL